MANRRDIARSIVTLNPGTERKQIESLPVGTRVMYNDKVMKIIDKPVRPDLNTYPKELIDAYLRARKHGAKTIALDVGEE